MTCRTRTPRFLLAALGAVAALALGACGDDAGHHDGGSASSIPASADFNQADVDFATAMIQHHAQALIMVDLTDGRTLTPAFADLAQQIRDAQGPEIEVMVDWLRDWDQPIPETDRDHVNAGHGDEHGQGPGSMPGMMSEAELTGLEAAQGADFERLWLELMIEHHEGALAMAEQQADQGEHTAAVELASLIIDAQQAEIDTMNQLLGN